MHRLNLLALTFVTGLVVACESQASTDSIGPNGIMSAALGLTGDGVPIGQVEQFRAGKYDYDDPNIEVCCNSDVIPVDVFVMDMQAEENERDDFHAMYVAGVMISTATTAPAGRSPPTGVAIEADLYSSSYLNDNPQPNAAITAQHLATALDVKAINMSFGLDLESLATLNGNSTFTLFVDWSATQHDVLYVKSAHETGEAGPVPMDSYNGMKVAMSRKETDGVFRRVSLANVVLEDPLGERTFVDILAPGVNLDLSGPNMIFPPAPFNSGTSFAAPHVTGTVALLQEYAGENFGANPNAGRHEVMKAVIMNSADKLKDEGDGRRLGMTRTVLKKEQAGMPDRTWLDSDAFSDDAIPLDEEMGTGHLNAARALQQFRPGESNAGGSPVPSVGWDYGTTLEVGDIQTYDLSQALPANQYVSITLAWDRDVLLDVDNDGDGLYDADDEFLPFSFPADLNLYLVPAGMGIAQAVAKSTGSGTSVEHIFAKVETAGMYDILVEQSTSGLFGEQNYALAWWTRALPSSLGDYSGNGTVGAEDYTIWKSNFGTSNSAADGNGDGIVDAGDYTLWRDHLGQVLPGAGSGALTPVPESGAAWLLVVGCVAVLGRGRAT